MHRSTLMRALLVSTSSLLLAGAATYPTAGASPAAPQAERLDRGLPVTRTNFQDHGTPASTIYTVRPVVNGVEQASAASADGPRWL
jgi:hypothetical protein